MSVPLRRQSSVFSTASACSLPLEPWRNAQNNQRERYLRGTTMAPAMPNEAAHASFQLRDPPSSVSALAAGWQSIRWPERLFGPVQDRKKRKNEKKERKRKRQLEDTEEGTAPAVTSCSAAAQEVYALRTAAGTLHPSDGLQSLLFAPPDT